MNTRRRRLVHIVLALAFPLALLPANRASADEGAHEAGKHFQRAVALYGEADYRAALVEFRRAYALSPNAAVLYNVGEAEYQLQDYAGALQTFEHYLTESSPSDAHHAEVESNVNVLARASRADSRLRRAPRAPTSPSTTRRSERPRWRSRCSSASAIEE